jgi:farnesyl diphosphate synthase/geranylgeranyl diphosphate synthase type II
VHDDLPAMDDDDLRRGKPTCHIAFTEASAILAGDGLQTLAFDLLTQTELPASTQIQLVRYLAAGSGAGGMVLGQAIDLAAVDHQLSLAQLETMHNHKTGALIRAAVAMGALSAGASAAQLAALDNYAAAIGLAFQVQDDILDVTADTATLGKQQGADIARNKPTYVSLLGLDSAKAKAAELHQQAQAALLDFGDSAVHLRQLARYIVERSN